MGRTQRFHIPLGSQWMPDQDAREFLQLGLVIGFGNGVPLIGR